MKETIKQKTMNRLHRHDSSSSSTTSVDYSSGEKVDFKFSSLQAIQVPRGWDKLSLSIISVETGRTIAKTGRASARNGNCQWTETLTESIWVPHDDDAPKELDKFLYKLRISMGSGRSGILGEIAVNLSGHLSSDTSISIAQPLNNCSHGTILQVEIQRLRPSANLRNDRWRDTESFIEDTNASDDLKNTSNMSYGKFTKSTTSSTSNNFMDTSQAQRSRHSFDSMDDSFSSEVSNDLIATNSAFHSPYHFPDSPRSSHSSSGKASNSIPASPLRTGSSEFVLEPEGVTVEELRAEARTWERATRKLMVDLDFSKKNWENATMEVLALKHEIHDLKALLDESEVKENANDSLKLQDKDNIQTELEEEMKFQKDLNDDLSSQLSKTQESNLELVSLLQELEEALEEKSKALLDNESEWMNKLTLKEEQIFNLEGRLSQTPKPNEVKALKGKIQVLERDCNELTHENLELLFKLKESSKDLSLNTEDSVVMKVKEELQKKEADEIASDYRKIRCDELESKCGELEVDLQGFKDKACYLDGELDKYRAKAEEQEKEIAALKHVLQLRQEGKHENSDRLQKEFLSIRHPQLDLELSDLRILKNQLNGSLKVMQTENTIISECLEKVKNDVAALNDTKESQITANKTLQKKLLDLESSNHELELHLAELEQENLHLSERISGLEPQLRYLTDERESSRLELQHSETRVSDLQAEIKRLETEIETSKIDTKQKSLEMQKRWLEAHEECEYLKKANPKLQSTAENLMEECASLQKSNIELKQRLELHNRCTDLESKLKESQHNFSNLSRNFEDLRHKLTKEMATKEKTKLDSVTDEYEARVLELTEMFENTRSSEEKLRITVSELDRNLKYNEYEIAQLTEEISSLKDQIQKLPLLQDEVVDLQNSLNDVKYEKERLEASLQLITMDYEEVKEERSWLVQKTSSMQKDVIELEDYKRSKIALEEKVMRLQGDLTAREALCAQEAELKNEVGRLKRSNSSLKRKVNCLQEEKDELEEKLEQHKGSEQDEYEPNSFLSEGQDEELEVNDEAMKKKTSLVEAELKELQERYLHMSLKYAEVEAQKEELLFKLKKNWFS